MVFNVISDALHLDFLRKTAKFRNDNSIKDNPKETYKLGYSRELNLNAFNEYFKAIKHNKRYNNLTQKSYGVQVLGEINKEDVIIFSVDSKKLDGIKIEDKKELRFLFDRVFIESPLVFIFEDKSIAYADGFFINKYKGMTMISISWKFCPPGEYENILEERMTHIGYKGDIIRREFEMHPPIMKEFPSSDLSKMAAPHIHDRLYRLLKLIDKKEYTTYKKWKPSGMETKEIVYSHDVQAHKRHFWKDTGRFKIPFMSKEELKQNGYETDEVVFRDGELRRDVPFTIIEKFVVGKPKPKKKGNIKITLLRKRILRQEEKVFGVLREIYPNELIRRHDRIALKGLELDFNLPKLNLAFEYDGEQHYDQELYEKLYGDGFHEQVKRDRLKDKLCKKRGIKLVRIKYDCPITKRKILKLISST